MTSRDPSVCRAFVALAKDALAAHPALAHQWSIDEDEDRCVLDFPNEDPTGFPVSVKVEPAIIYVFAGGFHHHFDISGADDPLISYALGFVRDLLSPSMRIREKICAGSPYKWTCESYRDGHWVSEGEMGLLLFPFFKRRSEVIRQNRLLPSR